MKAAVALVLLAALAACAPRAPRPDVVGIDPAAAAACPVPAVPPSFRAVHTMAASLPNGMVGSFIGVTVADAPSGRLRCTLVSVEGLVLFDAAQGPTGTAVYRALPPLDTPGFAEGLFTDVRFLFFPPAGSLEAAGRAPDGDLVCRWSGDGPTEERAAAPDGTVTLLEYTRERRILRRAVLTPPVTGGFHSEADLTTYGAAGYSLSMGLLEGGAISAADGMFLP